jgi:hypothetical protein
MARGRLKSDVNKRRPNRHSEGTVADVPYCRGGGQPLLMDVFIPRARLRRPTPAVLWLHGGGWERGDKNGSSGARIFATARFVTASIYYRLSGEQGSLPTLKTVNVRSGISAPTRRVMRSIQAGSPWPGRTFFLSIVVPMIMASQAYNGVMRVRTSFPRACG